MLSLIYARVTRVPPRDFAFWAKSLRGQLYLGIDIASRRLLQWVARIETLIGQQQDTGHTATR